MSTVFTNMSNLIQYNDTFLKLLSLQFLEKISNIQFLNTRLHNLIFIYQL